VALSDLGDRLRLTANTVDIVESPALPKLPVGHAVWSPKPDFATSTVCWLHAGAAHHTVMTNRVGVDVFRAFATMTGIELVEIGDGTTVPGFLSELRYNDAVARVTR
jgi:L-arabinose isomerase